MSEFKKEPRYVVFKIKDIHAYLNTAQIDALQTAGETIAAGRAIAGKPPFNAVVVEQDWPEFEMVWDAIEARMTANDRVEGRDAASSRRVPSHDGLEGNGTGHHE